MGWPWQVAHLLGFLAKIKWPSSKSYQTLKATLDGKLMPAKLHFLSIQLLLFSLIKVISNRQTKLFMYYDFKDIAYQLLEIIMKPPVLDSFKTKSQTWKDIDLSKNNNLISAQKLDADFAVNEDISNLKKNPSNKWKDLKI